MHDETVTTAGGRLTDKLTGLRSKRVNDSFAVAPGSCPGAARGSGALAKLAPGMPHPARGESASAASLSDKSPARRRETGTQEA
jgi:hypothetical protein